MGTRTNNEGLAYKALDLHVHSPGSEDYLDKKASADDLVAAALSAGLDGICITDHNTAEWVDLVKQAAEGTPLTVFPGVEISVTGGGKGSIHIIGIFEVGCTSEEINDLLSNVGLTKAKRGKTSSLANGAPNDVINQIAAHGGIPVLAHADSGHGVLYDMKGQPRTKVVRNPRLIAAEVSKPKYRNVLDGTDPHYKRLLATYEASDAHSLSQIGTKRTYFKANTLSLESLKQCFYDPDVRIRRQEEYAEFSSLRFPQIVKVKINKGFFDGETVAFHPCQNSIIGGQGVGKSLLVEFIRFALDQPSTIADVVKDTKSKLKHELGLGGEVILEIELANGTRYKVKRIYDGNSNPIQILNLNTADTYEGQLAPLFPIMAYSQTEAVYIARNPQAQLELIDRFIDAPSFERQIKDISDRLQNNDRSLVAISKAAERLADVEEEISTLSEQISNLEQSLESSVFEEMKRANQQKAAFEAEVEHHNSVITAVIGFQHRLEAENKVPELDDFLARNSQLARANQYSRDSFHDISSDLEIVIAKVRKSKRKVARLFDQWLPKYDAVESRYQEFLDEAGGDQKSLEITRKNLVGRRDALEKDAISMREKANRYKQMLNTRNQLLDELKEVISQFYLARKQKYTQLTDLSHGKLLLDITSGGDRQGFITALQNIATGTNIRKASLARIGERLSPRQFIDLVLKKDAKTLAKKGGVDMATSKKLINWLGTLEAQEKVLALQHEYIPQDIPSIQFRKENGKYREIDELSVGQKCTALLIIALSAGDSPIIIDQPEESIDIASVFSDIVSKLRLGKDHRQFILTTHNPNIAVTADSDLIHVLKSSATQGQVVNVGVIEDETVRREVIEHLEGGRESYLLRGKKYGLLNAD